MNLTRLMKNHIRDFKSFVSRWTACQQTVVSDFSKLAQPSRAVLKSATGVQRVSCHRLMVRTLRVECDFVSVVIFETSSLNFLTLELKTLELQFWVSRACLGFESEARSLGQTWRSHPVGIKL